MHVPDHSTNTFFLKTYKWNYPHAYGGGKVRLHPLLTSTPDGGERWAVSHVACLPAEKSPVIPRQPYAWRSSQSVRTLWKINIFCLCQETWFFIHPSHSIVTILSSSIFIKCYVSDSRSGSITMSCKILWNIYNWVLWVENKQGQRIYILYFSIDNARVIYTKKV